MGRFDKDEFVCCASVRVRRESFEHARYIGVDFVKFIRVEYFNALKFSLLTAVLGCFDYRFILINYAL